MGNRFRIVHFTDMHLSRIEEIRFDQLFSKRLIGFLNLRFRRSKEHDNMLARKAAECALGLNPDHVLITGDLVNLALPVEYKEVVEWLKIFGLSPREITVLPGNHDAYIKKVWPDGPFSNNLNSYYRSDSGWKSDGEFPVVRDRGDVRIIGCSTAVPSPPFVAWGKLGSRQIDRIKKALDEAEDRFCVIALHHPPQKDITRWDNGLRDAECLREIIRASGVKNCILLHGHMHRPVSGLVRGSAGGNRVLVWGTGSASLNKKDSLSAAQFRILDFESGGLANNVLYVYKSSIDNFIPQDHQEN